MVVRCGHQVLESGKSGPRDRADGGGGQSGRAGSAFPTGRRPPCIRPRQSFRTSRRTIYGTTAALLAISVGANVKAVQRMLGHKSAAMTLDTYADLFDDDLAAVAQKIETVVPKLCPCGQISAMTRPRMQNDQHFRAGHRCSPDWTRTNNRPV